MDRVFLWRGEFNSVEYQSLHDNAFGSNSVSDAIDWPALVSVHSMGWVTARDGSDFVGFVNVLWDGRTHAWIQDLMVNSAIRNQGVGTRLVLEARDGCVKMNCEWLHVDFEDCLANFYFESCGFRPSSAGLVHLK